MKDPQQEPPAPGMARFEHPRLTEEVASASGHYVLTGERVVSYRGRPLLLVAGYAAVDRSCCGLTGCGFAFVAGYVVRWKCGRSASGGPVSLVAPITDPRAREEIAGWVRETVPVSQVRFDPPWLGIEKP